MIIEVKYTQNALTRSSLSPAATRTMINLPANGINLFSATFVCWPNAQNVVANKKLLRDLSKTGFYPFILIKILLYIIF